MPDRVDVVRALAELGVVAERLELLHGGAGEASFLADAGDDRFTVKVRAQPRPLRVAYHASRLLESRALRHGAVAMPPRETPFGYVSLARWLPGDALGHTTSSDVEATPEVAAALGTWLRRCHTIRKPNGDWAARAEARFMSKVRGVESGNHMPTATARVVRAFWESIRPALMAAPSSLIHRDVQPGNVIVDGATVGLIDLEQARVADPLYDLVKPLETIARGAAREPFLQAYGFDSTSEDDRSRLSAVFLLEYLSAILYFVRRGDDANARDRVERVVALTGGDMEAIA